MKCEVFFIVALHFYSSAICQSLWGPRAEVVKRADKPSLELSIGNVNTSSYSLNWSINRFHPDEKSFSSQGKKIFIRLKKYYLRNENTLMIGQKARGQ